jgi:2-oxo-4-hydroxy-4-carboxy-5-ureidoimidazoline decarboxylase
MAARPFDTLASLLAVAEQLTLGWQPQQVASALSHHPRIGETAAADHARREQPSLTDHDGELKRALLAGNRQYEARFQHIFLIRAAGRDAEEILACLRRRLNNTDEQEQLATTEQLREITLLRLRQGFAP